MKDPFLVIERPLVHRQRLGALLSLRAVNVRVQFNVFSEGIHYGTKHTIDREKLQRFASQAQ